MTKGGQVRYASPTRYSEEEWKKYYYQRPNHYRAYGGRWVRSLQANGREEDGYVAGLGSYNTGTGSGRSRSDRSQKIRVLKIENA